MTVRLPPQCMSCRHWRSPLDTDLAEQTCTAFPKGIPADIWWNRFDHRKPHTGDHGVRWEADDGTTTEFPEWVMAETLASALAPSAYMGARVTNVAPSEVDLSQVQADWERQLDQLLDAWVPVSADQRAEIVDQVRDAIDANDVAALAALSASAEAAEAALLAAMNDMALAAAQRVVDEAAAQGVNISSAELGEDRFYGAAVTLVALLVAGLATAAGREALRRYTPGASGADVSREVREHLESMSDAFLRDNLGGALTAAQNAGRLETQLAGPTAAIYGSEWMDRNTCRPCREINGKWIGNSDDPDIRSKVDAVYPNGGYVSCLGGVRCRGTTVAVYRPQQTP